VAVQPTATDPGRWRSWNPLDPRNPLAGIYLTTLLFQMAEGSLRFLVPLNLHDRGQPAGVVGLVMFVFSFTSLLSRGVSAALFRPDRARWLILVAGLSSTAAYAITPLMTDPVPIGVLMAFDGFGWGVATTCLLAVVMISTPPSMSAAISMGWFVGFQSLSFAIATTVGGVLADLVGIQVAMLSLAGIPLFASLLIVTRLPSHPAEPREPDAGPAGGEPRLQPRRLLAGLAGFAAMPAAVWVAALIAIYVNVMNGLLASFFPLLGLSLGLSIAQIGTLSSIRSGASALSRFSAGWLLGRVSARRLMTPLLALSAGTVALLPSIPAYLVLLPVFAANGLSRGMLRVTTAAAAMVAIRRDQAGSAAAAMTAGLDVGRMIGPLIGGGVATIVGLDLTFRVVPLVFLGIYLVLYPLAARRVPEAGSTTAASSEG